MALKLKWPTSGGGGGVDIASTRRPLKGGGVGRPPLKILPQPWHPPHHHFLIGPSVQIVSIR